MITSFNLTNGGSYDDTELRVRIGSLEYEISNVYTKEEVYNKTEIDDTVQDIEDKLSEKTDVSDYLQLQDRVEEIELFSNANVTIVGEPTINSGQVSGFSANDYLQFPYLVHLHDKSFEIRFCVTTSENVTTQQNIIDSQFGLAIAVRNGHIVLAMSSNGTSWDMGEYTGTYTVNPNTTYHFKFNFDKTTYKLLIGDTLDDSGDVEYVEDITVANTNSLSAKEILIGKDLTNTHIFNGSINLNHCYLILDGKEVWKGISSNLETDLSNISPVGEERIKDLAKEIELIWYGTEEEYDALEDKTLYKLYVIQ